MGDHKLLPTQERFYEIIILLLDALFQIPNKVSYWYVTFIKTKLLSTVPIEILCSSIFLHFHNKNVTKQVFSFATLT